MWRQRTTRSLGIAGSAALVLSIVILSTANGSGLGAPRYWPWLLTGLQVLALWSAGTGRWWGWLLGSSVQIPWMAYAVVTTQIGFVPGCAVSLAVQGYSFTRRQTGAGYPAQKYPKNDLRMSLGGG